MSAIDSTFKQTNITPLEVASFFIEKSKDSNKELTNKKLQKLLYYSQAWSITLRNEKIFNEDIEAWVHGPAIRSVYIKFKDKGGGLKLLAQRVD